MNWYYAQNGAHQGPISQEDLMAKLNAGQIGWQDLVWREGMGEWMPASAMAELKTAQLLAPPPISAMANPFPSPYQTPQAMVRAPVGVQPPNYLWQSIVITFFCCLPFGVVAIVYAAKVDGLYFAGNLAAAQEASRSARTWCWVSFWCAFAPILIYLALLSMGLLAGALSSMNQ
jgi:hypothetical protein